MGWCRTGARPRPDAARVWPPLCRRDLGRGRRAHTHGRPSGRPGAGEKALRRAESSPVGPPRISGMDDQRPRELPVGASRQADTHRRRPRHVVPARIERRRHVVRDAGGAFEVDGHAAGPSASRRQLARFLVHPSASSTGGVPRNQTGASPDPRATASRPRRRRRVAVTPGASRRATGRAAGVWATNRNRPGPSACARHGSSGRRATGTCPRPRRRSRASRAAAASARRAAGRWQP